MNKDRRGRKPNPNGKILSNGLFERQWECIQQDAAGQGIDAAVLQRRIIDWYYAAKEMQKGITKEEFEKLPKKNKNKQKE